MKSKTILIYTLVFPPDRVSTAYLYGDIAQKFKSEGFEVTVLTSTPHYNPPENSPQLNKKLGGLYRQGSINGIEVFQIPQLKKPSIFFRIGQFLFFHLVSLFVAIKIKKIGIILSVSPPLTIGLISNIIAWFKGAKSIYNVQEIYPDIAVSEGTITNPVLVNLFSWLERLVYDYTDRIVTIDEAFSEIIMERVNDSSKVVAIPNFIDLELYHPEKKVNSFSDEYDHLKNSFVVGYVGNIGLFQNWEIVLNASEELSNDGILFMIVGEGIKKQWLEKEIEVRKLSNVHLFPYQDREKIRYVNATADIHIITMTSLSDLNGLPSKVFAIMASKRALIASCSPKSAISSIVSKSGCGVTVPVNDHKSFVKEIINLKNDRQKRQSLASNGYEYVVTHYSKESVTVNYIDLCLSLINS